MEKLQFALLNYVEFAAFLSGTLGYGLWMARLSALRSTLGPLFSIAVSCCLGLAACMVGFQLLGIAGLLNAYWICTILAIGFAALVAYFFMPQKNSAANVPAETDQKSDRLFVALFSSITIYLLPIPLHPPHGWDEVMYHLPHVREWSSAGRITVDTWLRYPLFPYNFDLLYVTGLLFNNDIFPQILYAFSGWLTALGLYCFAKAYWGRPVALISTVFLIFAIKSEFGFATSDIGLTLFIFFSFACAVIGIQEKNFSWLCVATFFLGIAAGMKLQALPYVPLLGLAILCRERKPARLLYLALIFLIPCVFWYVRSFVISGDPFNPMGAKLFGYWGWDAGDMAAQLADIKRVANWPGVYFLPAVAALLLRSQYRNVLFRAAVIFSVYAFVVWFVTSHYDRYLMPAYPVIAMLSALALHRGYLAIFQLLNLKSDGARIQLLSGKICGGIFFALLGIFVITSIPKHSAEIQANAEGRAAYLKARIASFEIGEYLKKRPDLRTVQVGLDSDIYYLPRNTIGDVFGPGRYRNFSGLSSADLASRLKQFNANALLLSTAVLKTKMVFTDDDSSKYFKLIMQSPGAELYVLTEP